MSNYDHLRIKLEEERERLERQLHQMARKDPHEKDEWELEMRELNPQRADASEMADAMEALETQVGIEYQLEERFKEVSAALGKMSAGTFGKCEVGGEEIEPARLEANPASKTCIAHENR